jgi:hypothetical protein
MGLLDDAIREHLELKRLRGADPGEVIREEHEALGPVVYGGEHAPEATDAGWDEGDENLEPEVASETPSDAAEVTDDDPFDRLLPDSLDQDEDEHLDDGEDEPEAEPRAASSDPVAPLAGEQETAEVDMQAMLDLDGDDDPNALQFEDDDDELGWDEPADREQRD